MISWVVAATEHGPMIVNRNDVGTVKRDDGTTGLFGVGFQLLTSGAFDPADVAFGLKAMELRRRYRGDGAVTVDVGANVGAMTVPWAKACAGWGSVHAFECQERVFYALAGNIALNNLTNAWAHLGAVTDHHGALLSVPRLNFDVPGSYGSLSLILGRSKDVGQDADFSSASSNLILTRTIDAEFTGRVDLIKVDVEGMELDVLRGAEEVLKRERPILAVEHLKVADRDGMKRWLEEELGYVTVRLDGVNVRLAHRQDPCLDHL